MEEPAPTQPARLRHRPKGSRRDYETRLAQIASRLENPTCRLLVLTGANPTRRGRLAQRAAARRSALLRHGLCDVGLAPDTPEETFARTLADALHLPLQGEADPRGQIFAFLRDKQMLLVIRNIVEGSSSARLLDDILKRAPDVQVLVTAGRPLDLCGEWILDLSI